MKKAKTNAVHFNLRIQQDVWAVLQKVAAGQRAAVINAALRIGLNIKPPKDEVAAALEKITAKK